MTIIKIQTPKYYKLDDRQSAEDLVEQLLKDPERIVLYKAHNNPKAKEA